MIQIPKTVNPDLLKERKAASFDVNEFANWFHNGNENRQMKRKIEEEIFKQTDDPFSDQYLSFEDQYTQAVKRSVDALVMLEKIQEKFKPGGNDIYPDILVGSNGFAIVPNGLPLFVSLLLFTKVIKDHGTLDLYEKYGRRAKNFEIIGSFAQTELGHGSFIRGIETRADYDRTTDEFVLNTPTLTSYKWWPGGLGQTANYCILIAQLYIDNIRKGIELFLVQVRDEETHLPMPGIAIGSIGKTIGLETMNNGYLGLKNVRIPRTNMLMKNNKVLADGTYIKSPISQINYLPMVYARCKIVHDNAMLLMTASTIVTRYSAVRRQSPINPDDPEPQIIDHVTQQLKVFPEIAAGIAYHLAKIYLFKLYNETLEHIHNSNDSSRLTELHALSCTLKATSAYDATFGIERLRLACGGHGYLAAANLNKIFRIASASCTYEGENSVLYLQVGRILLKTWADVLAGEELMPTMSYLGKCAAWQKFPKWTGTWQNLIEALQYAATNKTRIAFKNFKDRLEMGQTQPEAFNKTGIEITQAAELHGHAFVTENFLLEVTGLAAGKRSEQLNKVLGNLLELYLVHTVMRHMSDISRFIDLSEADLTALQQRLEQALQKLRPDVVTICDGFDFHDRILSSVLGCYDGNVYERIFESAQKSPLNRRPQPKAFHQYLKPYMKSKM